MWNLSQYLTTSLSPKSNNPVSPVLITGLPGETVNSIQLNNELNCSLDSNEETDPTK